MCFNIYVRYDDRWYCFRNHFYYSGVRRMSDIEGLASKREVETICKEQGNISPYDGTNIQFTSGTTGKPKAPFLSHRSYVNNSRQVRLTKIIFLIYDFTFEAYNLPFVNYSFLNFLSIFILCFFYLFLKFVESICVYISIEKD